jgi:adenylate kinase family enzyme
VINLNGIIPNKIHIIGSVGSGKTTLARNLSRKYSIPYYELDNVVWKRHNAEDKRRSEEERD